MIYFNEKTKKWVKSIHSYKEDNPYDSVQAENQEAIEQEKEEELKRHA